jgi:hypothetical protein
LEDETTMPRVLGSIVALVLLCIVAYPFGRDAYHRYEVSRRLDAVMDQRDRAAFRDWNGDAASFGRSLFERCELLNGRGAENCQRYRLALE